MKLLAFVALREGTERDCQLQNNNIVATNSYWEVDGK